MPTRITLNEAVAPRNRTPRFRSTPSPKSAITRESTIDENRRNVSTRAHESSSQRRKSSRKAVRLKSSLIRDKKGNHNFRALSSEDIRASPRLLGYCFQLLASIVMLISVSTFLSEEERENTEIWDIFNRMIGDSKGLYYSYESRAVFAWKLFGCFAVSGLGTIITLAIILVHFDTICFPSYWLRTFRDGSNYEQVLLISLGIFWAFALHINTSSLSVGQSQANVFFTSWISFFSAIQNYGIWRISAGRASIFNMINEHHRETT